MAYNPEDEEEEIFAKKDHNYKKEGKSKFYNVDSDQLPAEEQIGRSKFYGTADMDQGTPEREGFQDIFVGDPESQEPVTLVEK